MISLSIPLQINTVLGGDVKVAYDKLVLSHIELNPVDNTINAAVRLTSTSTPSQQAINGSLAIAGNALDLQVPQIGFFKRITLTGPQQNAVVTQIRDAQNAIEAGLVSLGIVAGAQSTGV
jgi:hypothetical protein